MQKDTELKRKLTFILFNYNKLKKARKTSESATVYITINRYRYETLTPVNINLGLQVVDTLLNYYKIENNGVDKFIEIYFFKNYNFIATANALYISEKTARNWKIKVIERAVIIAKMLNFK